MSVSSREELYARHAMHMRESDAASPQESMPALIKRRWPRIVEKIQEYRQGSIDGKAVMSGERLEELMIIVQEAYGLTREQAGKVISDFRDSFEEQLRT